MSAGSDIVPDRQEIWSSIYGALRLARFDETGHQHFNVTVEGFWRSFFAAVIVAPWQVLLISQGFFGEDNVFSIWNLVVHSVLYVASWVMVPLVIFCAIDLVNLGHRYTALIVAMNWTAVIIVPTMVLGFGLAFILPAQVAGLFAETLFIGLMVYEWFVIRTALQTSGIMAVAFLLFGLVMSGMLGQLAGRFL